MESWSAKLVSMAFVAGFYGSRRTDPLWVRAVRALAIPALESPGGLRALIHLRRYPALLTLYAHGAGLLAVGRLDSLRPLLADSTLSCDGERLPAAACMIPHQAFYNGAAKLLFDENDRSYSPAGKRITSTLRRLLAEGASD